MPPIFAMLPILGCDFIRLAPRRMRLRSTAGLTAMPPTIGLTSSGSAKALVAGRWIEARNLGTAWGRVALVMGIGYARRGAVASAK